MRISIKGIWFLSGGGNGTSVVDEISIFNNKLAIIASSLLQGTL